VNVTIVSMSDLGRAQFTISEFFKSSIIDKMTVFYVIALLTR